MLTQVIMLVHIMLLLIFTGSADSLTAAPMPTVMPTQTSATELMPTQTPPTDLMPTQTSPIPTVMPTQTPPTDLMPTQTLPTDVMPTQTSPTDLMPTAGGAGVSSEKGCSYRDVLTHLDFINDTLLYKATRPVLHHKRPTQVNLNVAVEAILGVVEKEQKLISRLYIQMKWINEFITWDPSKFCGIERVSVPRGWLWKPDITIDERLEDNNALNPYVRLYSDGRVIVKNEEMVVSTCRMNVYKFPFDTQSCNLTFASGIYKAEELELKAAYSSGFTRIRSMRVMWGEYEWEFEDFTYMKFNETIYKHQQIVYTITMKRKAVLYIVNFLLPVLFFLCLDMASFLMSDSSGEKLSFKVTVLLAVTVLQLILNDILPATSNTMPIIAMYCMGTFSLMLISLLETVVVTYLLAKDSVPQKTETDEDHNLNEDKAKEKRSKVGLYFYNVHGDDGERDTMHELQSVAEEDNGLKGESHGFQVILDELRDLEKNLRLFFKSKEDVGSPGYWTRIATRINKVFSIVYVTTVIVFLGVIFNEWSPEF